MRYIRGGYVRIYFKFTILKNYMHRARVARARGARARARASRKGRWDESTVNNSGSKLKIRLTGPLGNLLLFRSMGRGTRESKYRRRKVVNINCTKTPDLVAYPPCSHVEQFLLRAAEIGAKSWRHFMATLLKFYGNFMARSYSNSYRRSTATRRSFDPFLIGLYLARTVF
jgi:hypothetical protein